MSTRGLLRTTERSYNEVTRETRVGLDKGLSSSGERRVGTELDCSAQGLQRERNEVDRGGRIQLYPLQ